MNADQDNYHVGGYDPTLPKGNLESRLIDFGNGHGIRFRFEPDGTLIPWSNTEDGEPVVIENGEIILDEDVRTIEHPAPVPDTE